MVLFIINAVFIINFLTLITAHLLAQCGRKQDSKKCTVRKMTSSMRLAAAPESSPSSVMTAMPRTPSKPVPENTVEEKQTRQSRRKKDKSEKSVRVSKKSKKGRRSKKSIKSTKQMRTAQDQTLAVASTQDSAHSSRRKEQPTQADTQQPETCVATCLPTSLMNSAGPSTAAPILSGKSTKPAKPVQKNEENK